MSTDRLDQWTHDHSFGQDQVRPGERRTLIVIAITASMMVVEIVTGLLFGSMALLADGLHMASHTVALGIAWFAYVYARRHAHDTRFSFGTGKVNALGGFTGAVLLGVFAAMMAWESINRLIHPVNIMFDQAILVAVLGLVVNGACAMILNASGHHHHHHGHDEHHHDHDHHADHDTHSHDGHAHDHHHHDHNLRSAYLHVLADALTSVLAIAALLAGKYLGMNWMDPVMGLVGTVLVGSWALGLLRSTSRVLLDHQAPDSIREQIRKGIEEGGDGRISDLHVWSIGPGIYAAEIAVVAADPKPPDHYKALVSGHYGVLHATVEVHHAPQ